MIHDPNHHLYQRPQPPDMRTDGTPQLTVLRTSRARQVSHQPEDQISHQPEGRITEPAFASPRRRRGLVGRLVNWMLRGILAHWFSLDCGVLLVIGLLLGYEKVALPTWINVQDQWHLGDSRIVQLDATVGHGGISHFLAQWYHGGILVLEVSDNTPTTLHAYKLEPATTDEGTITLSIEDINHDGKPDLVIQVAGSSLAFVLYNNGTAFQQGAV